MPVLGFSWASRFGQYGTNTDKPANFVDKQEGLPISVMQHSAEGSCKV